MRIDGNLIMDDGTKLPFGYKQNKQVNAVESEDALEMLIEIVSSRIRQEYKMENSNEQSSYNK